MSTEHHNTGLPGDAEPVNNDVAFEAEDINTRTILAYMFYLAVSVIIAFAVSIFIFRSLTRMAAEAETPMAPVHKNVGPTMPPEPMLQGVPGHENDAQLDLREKRDADDTENDKLGWKDKPAGIAQIPVDEAMKIIAAKGLPALPAVAAEKKK